ncbi:hypothetical protein ACHAXR_008117 [Thalassiosira sp. AJA248-18]
MRLEEALLTIKMRISVDCIGHSCFGGSHRQEEEIIALTASHDDVSHPHRHKSTSSTLTYVVFALVAILNFATHMQGFPICNALPMSTSRERTFSSLSLHAKGLDSYRRYNFFTALHISQQPCHHSHQRPCKLNYLHSTQSGRASYSFQLFSNSITSEEQPPTAIANNAYPDTKPFNHDIARTLFAPLFFSLRHYQNNEQSPSSIRHRYEHPSPFEDPSSAQTAERMIRRMMENRYRSDGRTVCPNGRTFSLVAGAFGRLRCGRRNDQELVTWEEEPSINPHLHASDHSPSNADEESQIGQSISKLEMTPTRKLQQLLQLQLQLCHREGWQKDIMPSVDMYNRILKRLSWQSGSFRALKQTEEISDAEQAWLLLQFMRSPLPSNQITDKENIVCHPNAITYAHVIGALAGYRAPNESDSKSNDSSSLMDTSAIPAYKSIASLAEEIDIEMVQTETPRNNHSPEWFLTEAEALLSILEDEYTNLQSEPNKATKDWSEDKLKYALAHSYRCLLEGWGRYAVAGVDSGRSTSKNEGVSESEDNISLQKREHAIKRAHELLCRLEALTGESEKSQTIVCQTTIVPCSCYSSVLLALSISNRPSAASVAEDVLHRLISQYGIDEPLANQQALQSTFFNAAHAATVFSGCIAAHAKNNDAPNAEKILYQMIDLYHDGKLGSEFVPEVRAFGTCIALWSKYVCSDKLNRKGRKEFPSQNQRIYNAGRAEAILSELESVAGIEATMDNKNFILHATPYNIAILARVQTVAESSRTLSRNDKHNYDDREENEEIILHAQSILDHMEYEMGVTPDPYTYSILLHAWCQQSRPGNEVAADHAEELLRRRIEDVDIENLADDMATKTANKAAQKDIWPNVKHYSSVLKAHAKTKSPGGAKKALTLLSEMERRFYYADIVDGVDSSHDDADFHVEQKDVAKPDLVCYSIVIDAFANSRLPEASSVAHRLLRAVETKYDAGDVSMKPNDRIYTAVILSLVYSPFGEDEDSESDDGVNSEKRVNNAQRAWSILERMKKNDTRPNSYTYNYIINCAAETGDDVQDQQVSFEIALRAFQELRKASTVDPDTNGCILDPCHPDSFTFAFMIKACKNLLPTGSLQAKVISQTFQECCRSGYLNDAVLDRLWQGAPTETFYELIKEKPPTNSFAGQRNVYQNKSPIRACDLPMSWSRCCKRRSGQRGSGQRGSFKKGDRLDSRR